MCPVSYSVYRLTVYSSPAKANDLLDQSCVDTFREKILSWRSYKVEAGEFIIITSNKWQSDASCNWCKLVEITYLKVHQVFYFMDMTTASIVLKLNATMPLLLSCSYGDWWPYSLPQATMPLLLLCIYGNWRPYSLPQCNHIFSFKRSSATHWLLNPSRVRSRWYYNNMSD